MALSVHLFTTYCKINSNEIQQELDFSLKNNIDNDNITNITVFLQSGVVLPYEHPKVKVFYIKGNLTYKLWLESSMMLPRDTISLVANGYTMFDNSIRELKNLKQDVLLTLTGYNFKYKDNTFTEKSTPHIAQDAWAFRVGSQIPKDLISQKSNIPINVFENTWKLCYNFAIYGWSIVNPCYQIFAYCLENAQQSLTQTKGIIGGVLHTYPSRDITIYSDVVMSILSKSTIDTPTIFVEVEKNNENDLDNISIEYVDTPLEIFNFKNTLKVLQYNNWVSYYNTLISCNTPIYQVCVERYKRNFANCFPLEVIEHIFPPILNIHPLAINDTPGFKSDYLFWQYPNYTEKQAYTLHSNNKIGSNIDNDTRTINIYLGVPWATIADFKVIPYHVLTSIRDKVLFLKDLAASLKYTLKVHTVCQTVRWFRLLEYMSQVGVTDIHLSHYDSSIDVLKLYGYKINLHPWHIYAVNTECEDFTTLINQEKYPQQYLCSFVGAWMKHYPNDIRLQLKNLEIQDKFKHNVLINVKDLWHFNTIVFDEQVKYKTLTNDTLQKYSEDTIRYNTILTSSTFSLCPEGAGVNTIRYWESLSLGIIPVLITNEHNPNVISLHPNLKICTVLIHPSNLDNLFDILSGYTPEIIANLKQMCIDTYKIVKQRLTF